MKGKPNFYNLMYEDPRGYPKEMQGDERFWLWFQADWYESVIMTKSRPITEMKSIDWQHLENLEIPVVSEVVSACGRMNMHSIMNFNCDWNDEVIAQFYAALHIDRENKVLHWSLQGKPFSIGYTQFAALLGFPSSDLERPMIHDKNVLEDGEMHYMYDNAYGDVEFGTVSGLIFYYKMINQLLRYTVTPKARNSDKILIMSRNLLASLGPNQP